jgi:cellulase (glycosyl hydrolase family 5)
MPRRRSFISNLAGASSTRIGAVCAAILLSFAAQAIAEPVAPRHHSRHTVRTYHKASGRQAHSVRPVTTSHGAPAAATTTTSSPTTTSSTSAATSAAAVSSMVAGLKLMNYYPAQNPWNGMWCDWYPGVIYGDMAKIAALGANTVRIIVQPGTFGYPTPSAQYMSELTQMINMAAANGLRVQLTLFDVWSDYTDISGGEQWAQAVLAPFRGDPEISFVELQNEIDPTNATEMAWARTMLPVIRTDSQLPVTVSVTGWNTATPLGQLISALGNSQPDFYDLHFYGTQQYMLSTFETAKQMAAAKPLLIGETGYSTDTGNTSIPGIAATVAAHEQEQATYLSQVEQAAQQAGLPPAAPWVLNDFAPVANISATEQHFGLYRLDGSPKPAVAVIKAAFASF